MKRVARIATVLLATSSVGMAQKYLGTPAQDLFDQAAFFIEFNYNGFSSQKLPDLIARYQSQIDQACINRAKDCPYASAERPINNMIRDLGDPHSYFVPASVAAQFAGQLTGEGSGSPSLELSTTKLRGVGDRVITDVREDGPAGKAGLKRGDRILTVNGAALPGGRNANESLIPTLEERGQIIKFGIERGANKERLEISVTPVVVPSPWLPELKKPQGLPANVAVLRIHEFSPFEKVGTRIHELVKQAETSGATTILIDMRDNPGGDATECISGPGAFIPEVTGILERRYTRTVYNYKAGSMFRTSGNRPAENIYTIKNPAQFKGKVAALVNAESASCAEVFSAQLQYNKRGLVIGEETYGILNTATSFFPLADGSIMGLTIGRSVRPDGIPFPERVRPDVAFNEDLEALANGRDAMIEKALEAVNGKTALIQNEPRVPAWLELRY
jgi:carboxyl-terminal processing protease